ncbi:MAG: LmbE family N-acetylglucosaminyl deacetylase [Planctomycetota bacterium]|jgi:LmbE family N-acetylglucosaminyl deacetylase
MPFVPPTMPHPCQSPPEGPVLVVAPHPDDELVGPGGALFKHSDQGDSISVVVVCDGTLGDPDQRFKKEGYKQVREAETSGVLRDFLNCEDVTFFGFVDGVTEGNVDAIYPNLPPDPDDKRRVLVDGLATHLEAQIERVQPRVLYYPWSGEVHADHWACGEAVERLVANRPELFAKTDVMGYEVWSTLVPETILEITDVIERKLEAIRRYETQMSYVDLAEVVAGMNRYRAMLLPFDSNNSIRYAEVYSGRYTENPKA